MSARLSQALADFRSLRSRVESDADEDLTVELSEELDCVQEALESARREAEAWEAIEAWLQADRTRDAYLLPMTHAQSWRFVADDTEMIARHFKGAARLEALEAAGAFCRAELAK